MKLKSGVSINFKRQRYVDEIPDSVVDQIFPSKEGDEGKEIKKQKDAWVKKVKFVEEKKDLKPGKDVDSNAGS